MANSFKCKKCGHYEGTHDALIDMEQRAAWKNDNDAKLYVKQMKKDFPGICYNYEKTEEELQFDKNI